jgi:hypothetical protein
MATPAQRLGRQSETASQPARRIWGVRPDAISTVEEAKLELLREQIRDSRWERRKSQLRYLLPAGLSGSTLILWQLVARL